MSSQKTPTGKSVAEASPEDEGFLDRWSRRKTIARSGEEPEASSSSPDALAEPTQDESPPHGVDPAVAAEAEVDEATMNMSDLAERYGLPDPKGLGKESDFTVFMRDGVPDRLRTAALRQLWRASPDIGCLDGLVEYGEDFSISGAAIQTAYEVGKGFAKRIEDWERAQEEKERELAEREAEAQESAPKEEPQDEEAVAAGADEGVDESGKEKTVASPSPSPDAQGAPQVAVQTVKQPVSMMRRRMRFRFETDSAD